MHLGLVAGDLRVAVVDLEEPELRAVGALGADPAETEAGEPEVVVGNRQRPQVGVGLRGIAKRAERGGARNRHPLAAATGSGAEAVGALSVRIVTGPVYWRWSASTLPLMVSTRRLTGTVFAAAAVAATSTASTASAHGASQPETS